MEDKIYDIAIIGCGPAGLSAAINGQIRRKSIIHLGTDFCSPKLHKAPWVDNYLGLPEMSGDEMRQRFLSHYQSLGLNILPQQVTQVAPQGEVFGLLAKNEFYQARTVIIATGIPMARFLPGEQELLGKGVGYCATCDGPLYQGKTVAYIAENPKGEEELPFLTQICGKVYYLPLYEKNIGFQAANLEVVFIRPRAIHGQDKVEALELADGTRLTVDGVFLEKETLPPGQLIPGLELEDNHIKVNRQQETNLPGVFAAGDCTGTPYQLARAVGEGLVAALAAVRYLDRQQ